MSDRRWSTDAAESLYENRSSVETVRCHEPVKPSNLAVPLLILFVALSSRVVSLGTMLTFDEPYWITRSLTFFQALWEHDWAATYQTAHPGVSTMWLSGASLWLLSKPGIPAESQLILGVLPIALTTALAVVLMYWLSKKIFGVRIAAVGALLVALDPYYIAYSRVIHLDALLATFMILSVLATITYLSVEEKRYLALAGAFVGLALLTKFGPALLLVIFVPIAIFVWGIWKTRDAEGTSEVGPRVTRILLSVLRESGLVFLVAIATFLVLWPATWVQPTQVVVSLVQNLQHVETTPHGSGFFMGQVSNGDYPLSFYPVVMLMRSTPVTLILSAVCLAGFAAACLIRKAQNKHKAIVLLFLYVAAFIAAISLAATKFDRYALPGFSSDRPGCWRWGVRTCGVAGATRPPHGPEEASSEDSHDLGSSHSRCTVASLFRFERAPILPSVLQSGRFRRSSARPRNPDCWLGRRNGSRCSIPEREAKR